MGRGVEPPTSSSAPFRVPVGTGRGPHRARNTPAVAHHKSSLEMSDGLAARDGAYHSMN